MFGFNLQRRDQRNQQTNENMRGVTNQLQAALQQMERDRLQKQVQAEHDQDRQFLLQQREQAQTEHVQDREQEQIQRLILQREQAFKNQGIGDSARQYNRAMPTTSMPVPKLSLQQPQVQYKPPALPSLMRQSEAPATVPTDVNQDAAMFLGGGALKPPTLMREPYQSPDLALQGGDDIAQYLTDAQYKQAAFDVSPDKYRAQAMRTSGYNDAMLTPELFEAIARHAASGDAASQAELDWEQQQHDMDVGLYNSKLQTEDAKRRAMLVPRVGKGSGSGRGGSIKQQTATNTATGSLDIKTAAKAYASQLSANSKGKIASLQAQRNAVLRDLDTLKSNKYPDTARIEAVNQSIQRIDYKIARLENDPLSEYSVQASFEKRAAEGNLTLEEQAWLHNNGYLNVPPLLDIKNVTPTDLQRREQPDRQVRVDDFYPDRIEQAVKQQAAIGNTEFLNDLAATFQEFGISADRDLSTLTDQESGNILGSPRMQKHIDTKKQGVQSPSYYMPFMPQR